MTFVVGHHCIRHHKLARGIRVEDDAVADELVLCSAGEIADDAVLDAKESARLEHDAVAAAEADALDGDAAQGDPVVGAGIDGNAVQAARHEGTSLADSVVDDADPLRDRHRAVPAGIQHGDFAERQGLVVRPLKRAIRRQPVAIVAIVAEGRNKGARELGLGWHNVKAETKQDGNRK